MYRMCVYYYRNYYMKLHDLKISVLASTLLSIHAINVMHL